MVYFECQACNETVKKPKLAKHLEFCGSSYVTCIDCSKVFAWNEWEAHTSCVSEAQKYQGSLFQPKENVNKGQVKQDAWVDNVQRNIEDPASGISPQTKVLLQKLLGFTNIPRKQKPFANFVKNSVKIWDERKIAEMWEVISSANAASKAPTAGAGCVPGAPTAGAGAAARGAASPVGAAWGGWKRAIDEVLQAAPRGELPWKRLRDSLVLKYSAAGGAATGAAATGHTLEWTALANIPEAYLSRTDDIVRLPPGVGKA